MSDYDGRLSSTMSQGLTGVCSKNTSRLPRPGNVGPEWAMISVRNWEGRQQERTLLWFLNTGKSTDLGIEATFFPILRYQAAVGFREGCGLCHEVVVFLVCFGLSKLHQAVISSCAM